MINILKNKKGLTLAEALISMMLLAIITVGTYGVITASLRSNKQPDTREEVAHSIQQVNAYLKSKITIENDIAGAGAFSVCNGASMQIVSGGVLYDITSCSGFLPQSCDAGNSHFKYIVETSINSMTPHLTNYKIYFDVNCNGAQIS